MQSGVSDNLLRLLKNQKYHLVGSHSAVKSCKWLREALVNGRPCYKQRFYGIKTHRCMQMTPAVHYCNMHCAFCWRAHSPGRRRCRFPILLPYRPPVTSCRFFTSHWPGGFPLPHRASEVITPQPILRSAISSPQSRRSR